MLRYLFNTAIAIITTIFSGFIFSKMWSWFIVSRFPGVPNLNYLESIGVTSVFGFLTIHIMMQNVWNTYVLKKLIQKDVSFNEDTIEVLKNVVVLLVAYPIVLATAYFWHLVIK